MISEKWIDEKIREIYCILNNKGYETLSSCEGHYIKIPGEIDEIFSPLMIVFKDVPVLSPWLPSDPRWAASITYRTTYGKHVPHLCVFYNPVNFKESEQELDIARVELLDWAMKLCKRR
jgi:hypothetical protein